MPTIQFSSLSRRWKLLAVLYVVPGIDGKRMCVEQMYADHCRLCENQPSARCFSAARVNAKPLRRGRAAFSEPEGTEEKRE